MARFIDELKRTHHCGALRATDEGQVVVLFGWVAGYRDHGGCVFIDLREPAELAASGTVPGALPIPRGLLEFRADPESPDRNPAFQKPVVITYCASGGRAALAGKLLQEIGYKDVRNLGGFKDWVEAGGEVAKA